MLALFNLFSRCRVTKKEPYSSPPLLSSSGYDADYEDPDTPVPPAYLFRPRRPIVRPAPISIPSRMPVAPNNSPA